MSDANLTKLLYATEDAFGETPDHLSALTELRFLSATGAGHEKVSTQSEEIRSDRARSNLIQVGKNAARTVSCEFICHDFDEWILAALLASGWTNGDTAVTADASASGKTITATAGTFGSALRGAKFIWVQGFANAANNGIKRVVSATSTVITVADGQLAADQTGASVTITHRYARNGTTLRSFLLEEQYIGMTPDVFIALLGMELNQWNLNMEAQARLLQTFEFMGTQGLEDSATFGNGSPVAPSNRPICNTTGNIGSLIWSGSALTANILSFQMTLANGLRNRPALSRETTLQHGTGRCEPDGTLQVYFETAALYRSFLDHESASLLLPIVDAQGNTTSIFMPNLQFPSGSPTIEGVNTDIMLPLAFNARHDETLDYVIQIDSLLAESPGS